MLQQPDAGVKPPDGIVSPAKAARQKGGPLGGGANLAATSGGTAEQQAQRCPRCDSLNTKFCYYNNYSLSQPRHFCKNCRRYWTRGGALRNVPVGGGCRKNKRLKHRDPSCLAALADMDASEPSSILSAVHGIPGLATSTSSLIQELANEGNRLAFSRLGMPIFDKSFITGNDHYHQHPASSSAQDLFALGGPPAAVGAFDPSFPALTYNSKGDSQSIMFHPQHASEFTPFFDPIHSPSSLAPTLDHLSSFTAATPTAPVHHVNATSVCNTANMDAPQMSLMHHMPVDGMQTSHGEQHVMQTSSGGASFNQEEEITEISLRSSKGKSIISSLPDWGQQSQGAPPVAEATGADSCFFVSLPLGGSNENGLWNVSWPEMHAALAGSAGAMLH